MAHDFQGRPNHKRQSYICLTCLDGHSRKAGCHFVRDTQAANGVNHEEEVSPPPHNQNQFASILSEPS